MKLNTRAFAVIRFTPFLSHTAERSGAAGLSTEWADSHNHGFVVENYAILSFPYRLFC